MINLMKKLLFSLLLIAISLSFNLEALTLKERVQKGHAGDYIVTEQSKNYSLLFIRSLTNSLLCLEEVTVPVDKIDLQKTTWKEWLAAQAPGHSSWMIYEIDMQENRLRDCYSPSRKGWLQITETESLFTQLLSLSLKKVPESDLRRIGPTPQSGESDRRSLWTPPLVREGNRIEKPQFEVWGGRWHQDNSPLSGKELQLYFDSSVHSLPFPHWIECKGDHLTFKIRIVDSGKEIQSPLTSFPHRPLVFLSPPKKNLQGLRLHLKSPSYYKKLNLFALDITGSPKAALPIAVQSINKGE